ncbi:MAG: hypothetical protein JWP32_970 [Schumannella sp.]|nr:hypothetical protein [Schumannella sp.]
MTNARDATRVAHGILQELRAQGSAEPTEVTASSVDVDAVKAASKVPVRVFVTWAHSETGWTQEQTSDWERSVIGFTTTLRTFGIDADMDLYHGNDPEIDWTRFGQAGVLSADFVVIVNSKAWGERWSGTNDPTVGTGAVVETDALKGILQTDQSDFQRRVLLVKLPGPGRAKIPADLNRVLRFNVDPDDSDSFDGLLRTLTGQPEFQIPELGEVPVLPPKLVEGINIGKRGKNSREFSEYEALRKEVEKVAREDETNPNVDLKKRLATLMGLLDALQR